MHVVMLGWFLKPGTIHKVIHEIGRRLAENGIQLTVASAWSDSYASADLIIGSHPISARPILLGARIFGQRTVNRFQRMDIAERAGALVARFGSPANDEELTELARPWVDGAVLKYDFSSARKDVFHWSFGADRRTFPIDFKVGTDVFMEFLGSDPLTYKIDAFAGNILGGWILPTRDMREQNWQTMEIRRPDAFEPPPELVQGIQAASEALVQYGVGHASFDLMQNSDGYALIEINTCNVGTEVWDDWPDIYAANYSKAIMATLRRLHSVPKYSALHVMAVNAGNKYDVRGDI